MVDATPANACPGLAEAPGEGSDHLASYTYDTAPNGVGQPAEVGWGADPANNKDLFAYDAQGRVISQTRFIDGRAYTMLTLQYDSLDRPEIVQYPNGEVVTYTYDREGADGLVAGSDPLVTDMTFSERGQPAGLLRGNQVDTTLTYYDQTKNFRLRFAVTRKDGSAALLDMGYWYDDVGNILSINDRTTRNEDLTFTYDALNRLTAASGTGSYGYSRT